MKIKRSIANIILFICFTILLATIYYKIIPIIDVYGAEPFYIKEYSKTGKFEYEFMNYIFNIESFIDRGITSEGETYSYVNSHPNNVRYIADIETTNGEKLILSNIIDDEGNKYSEEQLKNEIEEFRNYNIYYICKLNSYPETTEETLKYYQFHADQSKFKKLDIYISIKDFSQNDRFAMLKTNYENFSYHYYSLFTLCIVLSVICIILIVYLTKLIDTKDKPYFFERMYFEEMAVIVSLILILGFGMMFALSVTANLMNIAKYIIYVIAYFIVLNIYCSVVKMIKNRKNRSLKQNFMIPKILENMQQLYKPTFVFIITFVITAYLAEWYVYFKVRVDSIIVFLVFTVILLHWLNIRLELIEINKKASKIAQGNFDVKIEKRDTICCDLIENINNIQKTMKEAIDEKLKSERLKTDLITNVSHDLKTPLTSIINYTNLLKKENIENEKVKKYIEILEQKSTKLKNLTEDLIEVSKLSSGNETAHLERLNFAEMVLQANGEFAEKFEEKNLNLISDIENEEMLVNIDGKKMWRVLENVYSNIYKYSLENTRVYVSLNKQDSKKIVFTSKNISKEELNISPDELMQRFVRGDKSRNSKGNGLGLSISKDLVELQGGKFEIKIEGDMFITKIIAR